MLKCKVKLRDLENMLKALRGTKDILPLEAGIWQRIESYSRDIFHRYNYKEIRTPIIEESSLFIRGIGEGTDIVQKEMYVFSDRGERFIALRPEATASIVRSYIENTISKKQRIIKLYYIGPMFRSERPQKGRQRQFHQVGVEAIGSDDSFIDVEVMALAARFLEGLGVKDFTLRINSLGCEKDKKNLIEKSRKNIKAHLDSLCNECKERYKKNVLRIFDCKNDHCREVMRNIKLEGVLCEDCACHFESVKRGLERLKIDYVIDPKIVRGLDYYTKTVFEISQKDLGAKDVVCAGGRYNSLIRKLGGEDIPAIGFAFGIERLILTLRDCNLQTDVPLDVFIAVADDSLYDDAFALMSSLRDKGFSCDMDYEKKALKAQMKKAEKLSSKFVIIFGEEEFKNKRVALKDMQKREQKEVELANITETLSSRLLRNVGDGEKRRS